MNTKTLIAAVMATALPFSAAAQTHSHDAEHIVAFVDMCLDGIGDANFCSCALDTIMTHLPPEHAAMDGEGNFDVSEDTPEELHNLLDESVLACRDEHLPHRAGAVHEHDDDHVVALNDLCMKGHGNRNFCQCVVEVAHVHLPPEYSSLDGKGAFAVSEDTPEEITTALDDAVLQCRDRHIPLRASHDG